MTNYPGEHLINAPSSVVLPEQVLDRLLRAIKARLPTKSFGYLLSRSNENAVEDFIIFQSNTRNSSDWRPRFESYGQYFLEHDDAGFVSTPQESWHVQKEIWARGMMEIGVFHSHLRHPANFSQIDYDMHIQRHDHLWHLIISVRNPELPQCRVFSVKKDFVEELPMYYAPSAPQLEVLSEASWVSRESELLRVAPDILALNKSGHPVCRDNRAIFLVSQAILNTRDEELIDTYLLRGFLRDSATRYEQWVEPLMRTAPEGRFTMGTEAARRRHFVGECPDHPVELSSFRIAATPVTNRMFGTLDDRRRSLPREDHDKPAVNLTWYDASVFAMWMGCRLPTEAEWEFACGQGSRDEWSCGEESSLPRYAWFSENSSGLLREVGSLEPNNLGLFDLHGNVWEWCQDNFDQYIYSQRQLRNPVHRGSVESDRVCRGGSVNALAEMCRTRFRLHEPPHFFAGDLGCRLAVGSARYGGKGNSWSR